MMTEINCGLEQFPGRIIFMSMYDDIVCGEKGNKELCVLRIGLCKKIRAQTLVVSWAWTKEEMVQNSYVQTDLKMGSRR